MEIIKKYVIINSKITKKLRRTEMLEIDMSNI
jgi:hypothetical protein